jgi:hypothetical protein
MGVRPAIAVIAALAPTAVALFCIGYLGDKYAYILSPEYVGTCYQSPGYLQSYITAMMTFTGLTGVAAVATALIFRDMNWFAYLCLCGVIAFVAGIVGVGLFAAGSC